MEVIARTMADAIKGDPSDGDWVVWITPPDAAARALRGLEAAGYVVRPADDRGAVDDATQAIMDALSWMDPETGKRYMQESSYRRFVERYSSRGGQCAAPPSSQHSSKEDRT